MEKILLIALALYSFGASANTMSCTEVLSNPGETKQNQRIFIRLTESEKTYLEAVRAKYLKHVSLLIVNEPMRRLKVKRNPGDKLVIDGSVLLIESVLGHGNEGAAYIARHPDGTKTALKEFADPGLPRETLDYLAELKEQGVPVADYKIGGDGRFLFFDITNGLSTDIILNSIYGRLARVQDLVADMPTPLQEKVHAAVKKLWERDFVAPANIILDLDEAELIVIDP